MRNESTTARVRVETLRELDALVGKYLIGEDPQTYWEDSHSFLRFDSIEEAAPIFRTRPEFSTCRPFKACDQSPHSARRRCSSSWLTISGSEGMARIVRSSKETGSRQCYSCSKGERACKTQAAAEVAALNFR